MRHPVQQPLGAPGTRRKDHLRGGDRTSRLAKPGPCRLGCDAVSGVATVIVERLDGDHGARGGCAGGVPSVGGARAGRGGLWGVAVLCPPPPPTPPAPRPPPRARPI